MAVSIGWSCGWRSTSCWPSRTRRRRSSSTKRSSWPGSYSGEEAVGFVNGVLDACQETARPRVVAADVRQSMSDESRPDPRSGASQLRRRSSQLGVDPLSDARSTRTAHGRRSWSTHTARRPARRSRPSSRGRATAGRILGDPQLRQGQLPRPLRRPRDDPGLHPQGRADRARLRDLQAARLRRLRRRRRAPVPHQDQRADDLGVVARVPRQVLPAAAREVARPARTSRRATASAISI